MDVKRWVNEGQLETKQARECEECPSELVDGRLQDVCEVDEHVLELAYRQGVPTCSFLLATDDVQTSSNDVVRLAPLGEVALEGEDKQALRGFDLIAVQIQAGCDEGNNTTTCGIGYLGVHIN